MRKTLMLAVVSLLLLWATHASAFYRGIAKPHYGDPDEFQTQRYHDETGQSLHSLWSGLGPRREALKAPEVERRPKSGKRRYLSINFAGRTFFLEH